MSIQSRSNFGVVPGAARGVAATLSLILLAGCGDNRPVGDS